MLRSIEDEEEDVQGVATAVSLLQRRGARRIFASSASAVSAFGEGVAEPAVLGQRSDGFANFTSAAIHGPSGGCQKFTGGSCLFRPCDESRAAVCDNGLCVCPNYMCGDGGGRCLLSAAEVMHAWQNGVRSVQETVSELAGTLPGFADALSSGQGVMANVQHSLTDALGEFFADGACRTYMGTCMFSDCPGMLRLTATCSHGMCVCKKNFCYAKLQGADICAPDFGRVFRS